MPNEVLWKGGTSRSTGINSAGVNAGANQLGSEIDNAANKDRFASLDLTFSCASAPTANTVWEVYVLYAIDGSNYEDGGAALDPAKNPVGTIAARAVTGAQRQTLMNVPILPFKFKLLLKSELDQNATSVTMLCYTHNEEIQ
jgi:hypothetical protein